MSISTWKRCSSCKTDIEFGQTYWVCNVSTCNRKRTGMYFCSVACWEAHLPMMRHREAWAVEKRAPSAAEWERQQAEESEPDAADKPPARSPSSSGSSAPKRRVVASGPAKASDDLPRDILIVVTKLKKYIKARSGMNTSDTVLQRLSDHVRWVADAAIESAAQDERKTVLERDIPPVPRRG
jgi:hypothetical protein